MSNDFRIKISADPNGALAGTKKAEEALKDLGKAATAAGEKSTKAAKDMADADEKTAHAKHKLKSIVEGLKEEFPALAHVAKLALNPIAASVAVITSSFALWNAKVEGLTRALAGVELPDLGPKKVGEVTAAAEAWKQFAEAVKSAVEAYNSVDAASDRVLKRLTAESEMKKKLMAADKQLELSKLERDKTTLSPGVYEQRKLDIEKRFAVFGVGADWQLKQLGIDERRDQAKKLRAEAETKSSQAGAIHVATAAQDEAIEADYRKNYDAAIASQAERRKRKMGLAPLRDNEGPWYKLAWQNIQMHLRYGRSATAASAIELEDQGLAADQLPIDQYNNFISRKAGRVALRARKEQLSAEAGKARGEAAVIEANLPLEQIGLNRELRNNERVNKIDELSRANQSLAGMLQQDKDLSAAIAEAFASGTPVKEATLKMLQDVKNAEADMLKRIRSLEGKQGTQF